MANCVKTEATQTIRECIKGSWHEKIQRLYVCTSDDGTSTWMEWRDETEFRDTGDPC